MRHVSQNIDSLTEKAQSVIQGRSFANFTEEELVGDQFAFARHVGRKARSELLRNGICRDYQVLPTRTTLVWRSKLDHALVSLFLKERESFSVAQLFSMAAVWKGDVERKCWMLQLDTGLMEIVVENEGDKFEERSAMLKVNFELPEEFGCLRIKDVERCSVEDGEWTEILN